jgi:23S rRNA (uracil1939-C5)-methyltransferase
MLSAVAGGTPWQFRNKVHFVVAAGRAGRIVMGHYARASRLVVPVRECPVHDARGNAVAFAAGDACRQAGARSVKGIAVRVGCTSAETTATLVVADDSEKALRVVSRRVLGGSAAPTSLHVSLHPRSDGFILGARTRRVAGPERLREEIGGVPFLISPTAFFQTNVRAAGLLVREVLAAVPEGASVLDLYAGAGLFALPLAKRGHHVVAVEENRSAVEDGEASLRLSRVPAERCRFVTKSVEAALAARRLMHQPADVVVLDPPRQGCRRSVLDHVFGGLQPATVVYVSCDPVSLARDVTRAVSHRYAIVSMQPVDMFPHTPHVETVVVLRRSS